MGINLLQTVKSKIGSSLAEHSASFFDEDKVNTGTAVDGTFAVILAGMIQRVSTDKGAKDLHKILQKEEVRDYDLEDLFTRSPQTVNGLVNRGMHFMPSIYPNKLREATNSVSDASNITKQSSNKMAKLCAPFLLSTLGKEVQEKEMSIEGLKTLLNGQKDAVKSALPPNLIEVSELSSFGWTKKEPVIEEPKPKKVKKVKPVKVEKVAAAATPVVKEAKKIAAAPVKAGGMGFFKWLIPLLAVLGLIWLLMTKGCGAPDLPTPKPPVVKEVVQEKVAVAKTAVASVFGKVNKKAMRLLDKIKFAKGSAGAQMMAFIKNDAGSDEGRFRFRNLNFASGSSNIAGESGLEVDNLSSILKAYEDIKVSIEGFTDSRGNADSNQVLSQKRAAAVRSRLIAAGISDARISTEGFGAANPVASNETAEGRAENRRIEIVIVK